LRMFAQTRHTALIFYVGGVTAAEVALIRVLAQVPLSLSLSLCVCVCVCVCVLFLSLCGVSPSISLSPSSSHSRTRPLSPPTPFSPRPSGQELPLSLTKNLRCL